MKDSKFSQMPHIYVNYPAFTIGFKCFKPANSFITLTLHNLYPFSKLLCFASVDFRFEVKSFHNHLAEAE